MAFLSKHVRRTESASTVLKRALKDIDRGRSSARRNTALVYWRKDVLLAALDLALAQEGAPE